MENQPHNSPDASEDNKNALVSSTSNVAKGPSSESSPSNVPSSHDENESLTNSGPSDFRPGRLSAGDVLARIFPNQRRTVLDLVLQGCNGDVLKAIEHFLSLNDSLFLSQEKKDEEGEIRSTNSSSSMILQSMCSSTPKSAFTPLRSSSLTASSSTFLTPRMSSLHASGAHHHHNPFPMPSFPFGRDLLMSGGHFNPQLTHFLLQQQHPPSGGLPFPSCIPNNCPPGCTQCPPPVIPFRQGSFTSRKRPSSGVGDVAVDLTDRNDNSSWRASPSSSGESKS